MSLVMKHNMVQDEFKPDSASRPEKPFVSIVVPAYNEEPVIDILFGAVQDVMQKLKLGYELILVNDGSQDNTIGKLRALAEDYPFVKVIDFSRNFGHQIAVTAGIEHAIGDVVILMDADLQDPPELIEEFLAKWREGYDVVYAVRQAREGESWFKKMSAKMFYRVMERSTDTSIPLDTGDFRLMNRNVVDSLCGIREKHRFVRGLVSWVGFKQIGVPYVRQPRYAGETKYPLRKMVSFAFDGITSFSHAPLTMATRLGFWVSGFGFLLMLVLLYLKLFTHHTVQGWTSIMIVVLFLGGIQLVMLGMLGQYIGRIYDEVRDRPLYIIKDKYNINRSTGKELESWQHERN